MYVTRMTDVGTKWLDARLRRRVATSRLPPPREKRALSRSRAEIGLAYRSRNAGNPSPSEIVFALRACSRTPASRLLPIIDFQFPIADRPGGRRWPIFHRPVFDSRGRRLNNSSRYIPKPVYAIGRLRAGHCTCAFTFVERGSRDAVDRANQRVPSNIAFDRERATARDVPR